MNKQTQIIEVDERVTELAQIKFHNFGGAPAAEHNMPCPQCVRKPAVIQLTADRRESTFQPCWECQRAGWVTVKVTGWRMRLLKAIGLVRK